jgi:hypothetical protein
MPDMLGPIVEFVLILGLCYALPIVVVLRSNRTAPSMRAFWVVAIVVFSLVGLLTWWMMSTPQAPAKALDPAKLPAFPAHPQDGNATVYLVRWAFMGALLNNTVCLDDRDAAPVAQLRGKGCVAISVPPGKHTLYVRNAVKWFEFPFEAHPGQVLAFSLNTKPENALANTLEGWLDEPNGRYQVARLSA